MSIIDDDNHDDNDGNEKDYFDDDDDDDNIDFFGDDDDYFGDDDDANLGVWALSSFMRASIPTWLSSPSPPPAARPASERMQVNYSENNDWMSQTFA